MIEIMDMLVNIHTVTDIVPTNGQWGFSRDLSMTLSGHIKWSMSAADLVWCTGHTHSDSTFIHTLILAHGSSVASRGRQCARTLMDEVINGKLTGEINSDKDECFQWLENWNMTKMGRNKEWKCEIKRQLFLQLFINISVSWLWIKLSPLMSLNKKKH